jgi:type IV pilus assembly protein PilV
MLKMNKLNQFKVLQQGVMLVEALVALLIFSIGILAIIGLQANSIKMAGDAKYRSDANLLANRLVGAMWVAHASPTFIADFSTGGAQYSAWAASVASAIPATGASAPTVTIVTSGIAAASAATNSVTISIFWCTSDAGACANSHRYDTSLDIPI